MKRDNTRCWHCYKDGQMTAYPDDVMGGVFHACNDYHAECYMYEQYGDYELDDTTEEAIA
jgi:hypothetical protein